TREIPTVRSAASAANFWIWGTGRQDGIAFQRKRNRLKKSTDLTEIAKTNRTPSTAADWIGIAVATAMGTGFVPRAPGTAGAAGGVLVYLAIESLGLGTYYPHAIILFFVVGIWASFRVEELYGHDSQRIVIDEVVGQM